MTTFNQQHHILVQRTVRIGLLIHSLIFHSRSSTIQKIKDSQWILCTVHHFFFFFSFSLMKNGNRLTLLFTMIVIVDFVAFSLFIQCPSPSSCLRRQTLD